MPTGKVKWYDAEKGFGFLSKDDGGDVYVRSSALPDGTPTLKAGTRVEFGVVAGPQGRPGAPGAGARRPAVGRRRRAAQEAAEDMVNIIEDLSGCSRASSRATARGRHPDAKIAKPTAKLLRALADELEL